MARESIARAIGVPMLALVLSVVPVVAASPTVGADPTVASGPEPSLIPADDFEFVAIESLADPRINAAALLLDDGRVLIVGGHDVASAEIWDPATGQWTLSGSMAGPREGLSAILHDDGRVVVVGGTGEGASPDPEVWDPTTGTFSPAGALANELPDPPTSVAGGSLQDGETRTLLPDGRVLLAGGWEKADPSCRTVCKSLPTAVAAIWDPATGVTTPVARMTRPRAGHIALLLRDGRILLVGSHDHGATDSTAELFQPRVAPLPPSP